MSSTNKSEKYLLIDSCIAEYVLNKDINPSISRLLAHWSNNIFDIAISGVTYSELIHTAKPEKEKQVINLLDSYHYLETSKRVLKGAGILGSIYKNESTTYGNISLGDRIVAATSVVYNTPIITANVQDFPRQFFNTFTFENVSYIKGSKEIHIYIAVLLANYPYIKSKMEEIELT